MSDTPRGVSIFLLLILTSDTSRTRLRHACPILDTLGTRRSSSVIVKIKKWGSLCNCEKLNFLLNKNKRLPRLRKARAREESARRETLGLGVKNLPVAAALIEEEGSEEEEGDNIGLSCGWMEQ